MKQELSLQTGRIAGTLRAGISINYAMYRLPDELADYNERYPAVTTQITTTSSQNVYAMLMANQINVGILRGEYSEWRGERILLAREHICAITSQKDRQTPLSGLPQISRPADDDMERMLAQWMRENHLQASPNRISVNSTRPAWHGRAWARLGHRAGNLPRQLPRLRPPALLYQRRTFDALHLHHVHETGPGAAASPRLHPAHPRTQ